MAATSPDAAAVRNRSSRTVDEAGGARWLVAVTGWCSADSISGVIFLVRGGSKSGQTHERLGVTKALVVPMRMPAECAQICLRLVTSL